MYKGTLWLDYDDSEEEAHFEAELSLAKKGDTISFSFIGTKSDDAHPFYGKCSSKLQNQEYKGEGSFSYQGETETKSIVNFTIEEDDKELFLTGTWRESGDKQAYILDAELEKS